MNNINNWNLQAHKQYAAELEEKARLRREAARKQDGERKSRRK